MEIENFKDILGLYSKPEQIVFEITERAEIKNFPTFCQILSSFKTRSFKISINDVGSGYSSLDAVAEMKPDFVKIDMALIREISTNSIKQNLVKAIVLLCKQSKIVSIGEGIETEGELNTLVKLEVEAGQGYLLGKPGPEPIIDGG